MKPRTRRIWTPPKWSKKLHVEIIEATISLHGVESNAAKNIALSNVGDSAPLCSYRIPQRTKKTVSYKLCNAPIEWWHPTIEECYCDEHMKVIPVIEMFFYELWQQTKYELTYYRLSKGKIINI